MIHFVYRAPRYGSIFGKISEKLAFSLGLPEGFPAIWRKGNHLPWRTPVRAPHSISFNLLKALKQHGEVKFYDLYEKTLCDMKSGDIFLGVPVQAYDGKEWNHPDVYRVAARTLEKYGNREDMESFIIMPYTHDPLYNKTTEEITRRYGKNMIIICGKHWSDSWDRSPIKGSVQNLLRVDMAIDSSQYPVVKRSFSPKGSRRFLYIGHAAYYKNTAELERIAAAIPEFEGGHIGGGTVKGWKKLAEFADLTPEFMGKIAKEYDIFLNTSSADAQATTLLEAMCFGFVVACTPESGIEYPSVFKLDTTDTAFNLSQIEKMQQLEESELLELARKNRAEAEKNHNWNLFCSKVIQFIHHGKEKRERID